jgi:hypothetical protein
MHFAAPKNLPMWVENPIFALASLAATDIFFTLNTSIGVHLKRNPRSPGHREFSKRRVEC